MFVPKSSSSSSSAAVSNTAENKNSQSSADTNHAKKRKEEEIKHFLLRKFLFFYPFLLFEKDYQFMISEVQCNDPSCVPIETLIVILLNDSSLIQEYFETPLHSSQKILKPMMEVTENDLEETIDCQPFSFKNQSFYQNFISIRSTILQNIIKEQNKNKTPEINPEKQFFFQQMMKNYNNTDHLQTLLMENTNQLQIIEKERKKQADEERKRKIQEANDDVTVVKMKSSSSTSTSITKQSLPVLPPPQPASEPKLIIVNNSNSLEQKPRHEKDRKRSGCPCCDPDNLDNKIDRMMFLDIPPN